MNLVAGLERIEPLKVLYTDFTEIVYADGQARAHLMVILDHTAKLAVGHAVGRRAVRKLALEATRRTWTNFGRS